MRSALAAAGEATAYWLLPAVYGDRLVPEFTPWLLTKALCYLTHLEVRGEAERLAGEPERWRAQFLTSSIGMTWPFAGATNAGPTISTGTPPAGARCGSALSPWATRTPARPSASTPAQAAA